MAQTRHGNRKSSVSFASITLKADTQIVTGQPLEIEDEFNSLYEVGQTGVVMLAPPYNPSTLVALSTRNNILQQCVQAMEVNVDGTGHTIEPLVPPVKPKKEPLLQIQQPPPISGGAVPGDKAGQTQNGSNSVTKAFPPQPAAGAKPFPPKLGDKPPADGSPEIKPEDNDPEKKKLEAFFKEPYPGMSMVSLRRKLRVDLEQTGNAYIEVLRNAAGDVRFLRSLEAQTVRLVKLDAPVMVDKAVASLDGDKDETVSMWVRERRFAQMVSNKKVYFSEFGASRKVERLTGRWVIDERKTPPDTLGNEVIHLIVDRDGKTPYGVPRWINNLPSVLGSRKAEEFNLEFFDAGGLPPAIILIAGGAMTTTVKEQLLAHMAGRSRSKHRAAVVEVQSVSGDVDKASRVDIKVERFGDAKQGDAMFMKYDVACEEHVRIAFRLPPLFVGRSGDYSFATASVSYMIAEEQVFAPERLEFDEIINNTLVKALGVTKYKYVSKPTTLKNVEIMIQAVIAAKDVIDGEERIRTLNEISGTKMEYSQAAEHQAIAQAQKPLFPGANGSKSLGAVNEVPTVASVTAKEEVAGVHDLLTLADQWVVAAGLERGPMSDDERKTVFARAQALKGDDRRLFNRLLASRTFTQSHLDPEGLAEIVGACRASL